MRVCVCVCVSVCVYVCVSMCVCVREYTNSSAQAGYNTRLFFNGI